VNWLADEDAEGKETPWALIINENPDSKNMHHKYYHHIQSYFINTGARLPLSQPFLKIRYY